MKKIIMIVLLIISMYLFSINEYNTSEEDIRFRVIANSNQKDDIIMKEKVVKELSGLLFNENLNYDETDNKIYNNLKNI